MSKVHMRSFWLGAHSSLAVINLILTPLGWWFLAAALLSGFVAYANWKTLQEEQV
jgi:hypothetical protein